MSIQRNIDHQFYFTIPNVSTGSWMDRHKPETVQPRKPKPAEIRDRTDKVCASIRRRQMRRVKR